MEAKGPKIKGGYILYPRCFLDMLGNLPLLDRCLWTWLNCKANHKDGTLKRGQTLTTTNEIAHALCYRKGYASIKPTSQAIRKSLERLCERHLIGKRRTTRGTIITIRDYETYQSSPNYETHAKDLMKDTAKVKQTTSYKQEYIKNDKKKEGGGPPKTFYQMDCEKADAALQQAAERFLSDE